MKFEAFLKRVNALKRDIARAEVALMEFLLEQETAGIHMQVGCTFEEMLSKYSVVKHYRYARYKRARERYEPEELQKLGIFTALMLGGAADDERVQARIHAVAHQSVKVNAHPITEQTARRIAEEAYAIEHPEVVAARLPTRAELTAENERLRQRVAELELENNALRTELEKMREAA